MCCRWYSSVDSLIGRFENQLTSTFVFYCKKTEQCKTVCKNDVIRGGNISTVKLVCLSSSRLADYFVSYMKSPTLLLFCFINFVLSCVLVLIFAMCQLDF